MGKKQHLIVMLLLLVAFTAGCGQAPPAAFPEGSSVEESVTQAEVPVAEDRETVSEQTPALTVSDFENSGESSAEIPQNPLPLSDEMVTFTYFIEACDQLGAFQTSWSEGVAYKTAEQLTNVQIEFLEQPIQSYSEKFNLMIASGDYADLLKKVDDMYAGGISVAVEEEVIVDVASYINTVMPNYLEAIEIDASARLGAFDENGAAYSILKIQSEYSNERGLFIRQDWLDELGLEVPETYDELHTVLTAFKNTYNCAYPYYLGAGMQETCLSGGLGTIGFSLNDGEVASHFYHDGSTVKSALIEDTFKEYLLMLNQFYSEGILNPDFYTAEISPPQLQAICYGGQAGIFPTEAGQAAALFSSADDPNFSLSPVADIVQKKGEKSGFAAPVDFSAGGEALSITSACEDPELLCKYLDFWYSDKGIELANYGIENENFVYESDGTVSYTELITNNPNGMPPFMAKEFYKCTNFVSINIVSSKRLDYNEMQLAAVELFTNCAEDLHQIPDLVKLNQEESAVDQQYLTSCETYAKQMTLSFVTGEVSFDQWDTYVQQLKELHIEDCIAAHQAAYDRYLERVAALA